jgi:hypothetical protein
MKGWLTHEDYMQHVRESDEARWLQESGQDIEPVTERIIHDTVPCPVSPPVKSPRAIIVVDDDT